MPSIKFNFADIKAPDFTKRMRTREGLLKLFENEGKELVRLDYIFCSDSYLLDINVRFLGHNYLTDVITFDMSVDKKIAGEAYISIDRVRENARIVAATFQDELGRVVIHAALHLCGYKDKEKRESRVMRQKEDYYLKLFLYN